MTEKEALKLALEVLENINQMVDYEGNDFRLEVEIATIKEALAQPPLPVHEPINVRAKFLAENIVESIDCGDAAGAKATLEMLTALAQPPLPVQEPVAWGVFEGNLHDMFFTQEEAQEMADLKGTHAEVRPFYTTPPASQPKHEPVAKVVSTAPDRIWLDLGFDPQDEYEVVFHELHDVTWSQDNASGNGIEYVRADTVPPAAQPAQEPVAHVYLFDHEGRPRIAFDNAKGIKIGDKLYTTPAQRPWVGLTDEEVRQTLINYNMGALPHRFDCIKAIEDKLKELNT